MSLTAEAEELSDTARRAPQPDRTHLNPPWKNRSLNQIQSKPQSAPMFDVEQFKTARCRALPGASF